MVGDARTPQCLGADQSLQLGTGSRRDTIVDRFAIQHRARASDLHAHDVEQDRAPIGEERACASRSRVGSAPTARVTGGHREGAHVRQDGAHTSSPMEVLPDRRSTVFVAVAVLTCLQST